MDYHTMKKERKKIRNVIIGYAIKDIESFVFLLRKYDIKPMK